MPSPSQSAWSALGTAGQLSQASPTPSPSASAWSGFVTPGHVSQPAGQVVGSPQYPSWSKSALLQSNGQGSQASPRPSPSESSWSGFGTSRQLSHASVVPSPSA